MNILMMTNTYSPHVGGVARSVKSFTEEFRRLGHRVVVVAPEFEGAPPEEKDVVRVPAIQRFNGSDFSVQVPVPGILTQALAGFRPDIVHSHHPFLLGDTALRVAHVHGLPLVFTHHTMYEEYTHYVPLQSPALKKFAVELSTGYANLADVVFAPSESVARCIRARGVRSRVAVVPTGVETAAFSHGDGADVRARFKIPPDAFVIGHLGRLAAEKNLEFLVRAVTDAMHRRGTIHFLLVGGGPFSDRIREQFRRRRLGSRLHLTGVLEGEEVADAYAAMDIFAFSSKSETQGLVVAEAMAAGVPVVALDAPGAREVVKDGVNGRLLSEEDEKVFAEALLWAARRPSGFRKRLQRAARATAARFSMEKCARRALRFYEALRKKKLLVRRNLSESVWENARRWFEAEWELVSNMADAATAAFERRETPGLR